MASKEFLHDLFRQHLADLSSVRQEDVSTFICPICLSEYTEDAIDSGDLTDGHVWPEYLRQKGKGGIADQQRVLLCKKCNNTAGSRGDKQMQLREKVKDGEKAGQLFDERHVQILPGSGEEPVNLRARIVLSNDDMTKGQISFQVDKETGQWSRNNPSEQERFLGITKDRTFGLVVYPPHELRSRIARVGWITSAYLFAFYTLGYRYILMPGMQVVRDYILNSFDDDASDNLEVPKLENFGISECKVHYNEDPAIGLVIPMNREESDYLQVSFLDYHIRLPVYYVAYVIEAMIQSSSEIMKEIQENVGTERYLYIPIACNKSDGHECKWDYILGKPIPDFQ